MAKVYVVYKIMPDSPDRDREELKKKIEATLPKDTLLQGWEEEPIAFGLYALKVGLIIPEEEGYSDKLEENIRKVEGIESLDLIYFSRA